MFAKKGITWDNCCHNRRRTGIILFRDGDELVLINNDFAPYLDNNSG